MLLAEGLEEDEDLAIWMQLGAHAAQGYLLARPEATRPLPTPSRSSTDSTSPVSHHWSQSAPDLNRCPTERAGHRGRGSEGAAGYSDSHEIFRGPRSDMF